MKREPPIEQRLAIDEALVMGLNFSVTCAEDLPYITQRMIRENTPGMFLGDYRIRQQKTVCGPLAAGRGAGGRPRFRCGLLSLQPFLEVLSPVARTFFVRSNQ